MSWDWDKLQEKRQHQPQNGWNAGGRDKDERKDNAPNADDHRDTPGNGGGDRNADNGGGDRNNGGNGPDFGRRQPPFGGGRDPLQALRGLRVPGGKWWILGLAVLWLASGIYIVQPDESGVVLRFGRYARTETAGPHYHLPYPFEEVYRPKVSQVRQAEVGFRSQSSGGTFQQGRVQPVDEEAAMLTGDENIVNIQFNIQYHIKPDGAVDYLFNVTQPDAVVKKAAEAAMREVIGKTTLDAALTGGRIKIQDDVTQLLQSILDRYQVGVQVVAVQMQDVQPPRDVSDAFKDVASAREDKQRLTNEAEAYRRDILPKAQGDAAEIVNQAEAYRQTRIRAAEGDAERFLAVLEEYEKAPEITKKRMMYETLEDMLSQPGMEKLVLPSGMNQNMLPFLPLDSGMRVPSPTTARPEQQSTSQATSQGMDQSLSRAKAATDSARLAGQTPASPDRAARTSRGVN